VFLQDSVIGMLQLARQLVAFTDILAPETNGNSDPTATLPDVLTLVTAALGKSLN
jgi:hypothetical protein